MIYQNDPEFETVDAHFACCLFSMAYQACRATGVGFTSENMLEWLKADKVNGVIGPDDFLEEPQGWLDTIAPQKLVYLDEILAANYEAKAGEFIVDYLFNPDTGFHHFVVGWQPGGQCEYDPINYGGVGSNTARGANTYIESRRGLRIA